MLLEQNSELIETHKPRTAFDRCGYRLRGVLGDGTLDLPRLLVGSESMFNRYLSERNLNKLVAVLQSSGEASAFLAAASACG